MGAQDVLFQNVKKLTRHSSGQKLKPLLRNVSALC